MMHFVRTFRFMFAGGVGIIVIQEVQNCGIVFIKNIVENGWLREGDARIPHIPLDSPVHSISILAVSLNEMVLANTPC